MSIRDEFIVSGVALAIGFVVASCVPGPLLGDYVIPDGAAPKLSHMPDPADVVRRAPQGALVTVPAEYIRITQAQLGIATNLAAVVADSRANIPELRGLADIEVAMLYLRQMSKAGDELLRAAQALGAPTNTMEYLIGAGMRQDLAAGDAGVEGNKEGDLQ